MIYDGFIENVKIFWLVPFSYWGNQTTSNPPSMNMVYMYVILFLKDGVKNGKLIGEGGSCTVDRCGTTLCISTCL